MTIKQICKRIFHFFKKKKIITIEKLVTNKELLQGKNVLVIGGTGGIGKSIISSLKEAGATVACTYNKKTPNDIGCDYAFSLNLLDINSFDGFVSQVFDKLGTIDSVILASGVHIDRTDLNYFNITPDEFAQVFDINLIGPYFLLRKISQYMITNNVKGHILLINSSRAYEPGWSPYGLSKVALESFTKGMAQQLIRHNIIVNAIAPGPTATRMNHYKDGDSIWTDQTMSERLVTTEEIGEIAKILISDLGNTIVGQTICMSLGRGVFDIR